MIKSPELITKDRSLNTDNFFFPFLKDFDIFFAISFCKESAVNSGYLESFFEEF